MRWEIPKYQAPFQVKRGSIWWRQVIESCHHERSDSGSAVRWDFGSVLGVAWVMLEKLFAWVSLRIIVFTTF
jgi:hypothetical protein